MCPCHGVSVLSAAVNFNVEEYFRDPAHQQALTAYLDGQGITVRNWWPVQNSNRQQWAIAIGTLWTGLAFKGSQIIVSIENARDGDEHADEIARAYALTQQYIGQVIQAQMIEALTALNLAPSLEKQHPSGAITLRISV